MEEEKKEKRGPGRPPKAAALAQLDRNYDDPIEFLKAVMNHQALDVQWRIVAAKTLMPFMHKRNATATQVQYVSKKERETDAAQEGLQQFFGFTSPPKQQEGDEEEIEE